MKKFFKVASVFGSLSLAFGAGTVYGSMVASVVAVQMLDCSVTP